MAAKDPLANYKGFDIRGDVGRLNRQKIAQVGRDDRGSIKTSRNLYVEAEQEAQRQAREAIKRRQPRDPKNPYDLADKLNLYVRNQEMARLGVGRSRASTLGAGLNSTGSASSSLGGY